MMHEIKRKKPEPKLLPTQGIYDLPHRIGMVCEELAVSYTQWLAEVMAWGIEPQTFRLGVRLRKKSDTLTTLPQRTPQSSCCCTK